jgi:hypothetical protein
MRQRGDEVRPRHLGARFGAYVEEKYKEIIASLP